MYDATTWTLEQYFGNPQWSYSNGRVYLRGALIRTGASIGSQQAVLDISAAPRPYSWMRLITARATSAPATRPEFVALEIASSGVFATSNLGGSASSVGTNDVVYFDNLSFAAV